MSSFRAPSGTEEGVVDLNKFLEVYKRSDQTIDSFYLDGDNDVHAFDIFDNFLNDYDNKNFMEIELTDAEVEEFKYSPKAMSYRIYGTIDYWSLLLRCMNVSHPGEFEPKKIVKVPDPEALQTFFSKISSIKTRMGTWSDLKDIIDKI